VPQTALYRFPHPEKSAVDLPASCHHRISLQHPTTFHPEQLLEWSRARDKSVSRATIYRTLPLLTESGLLREMDFGKDYKFYDPNYAQHPNHNHIICQDCDKIVEFDSDKIEKIENEITHRLGFSVKSHRLQITATCEDLKKLGACKKKTRS